MKKNYQKPTVQIVKLKQQAQLLAGSVEATRSGYGTATDQIWD